MDRAYLGDAIIRMWIRGRLRHDFLGREAGSTVGKTAHEDRLNSNKEMTKFAQGLFPECQGKRVADNFEALVCYMYDNGYAYEYLLEAYYENYMLTQPREAKSWARTEMRCPLMNDLRKKNKL